MINYLDIDPNETYFVDEDYELIYETLEEAQVSDRDEEPTDYSRWHDWKEITGEWLLKNKIKHLEWTFEQFRKRS